MKNSFMSLLLACCFAQAGAQELFVFTEPASNMPTNSIAARMTIGFYDQKYGNGTDIHLMSEIHYGISPKLMVQAQGFISNRNMSGLTAEGGGVYAQYKFLNLDDVQQHFRMAAYGRYSFNNAAIEQEAIETAMLNSGYELGVIATQLLHKLAISSSVSYERALNNGTKNGFPEYYSNSAMNYTLSFGQLVLPKKYTGYDQTNLNLMVEFLGQRLNGNGKSYLDIAPSIQFIIKSKARVDLAYRQPLYSDMCRMAPKGFLVRFEYNFYNVF
jgi:hypothetical protein